MRIIAGEHKGRTIIAPEGLDTRPTTDRVRESIMSSLYSMLGGFDDVRVLDAFSGSGAMALETMSRGAAACVMNDMARTSQDAIKRNRDAMGYPETVCSITTVDVLRSGLPRKNGPFDIVFLDPPYATEASAVFELLEKAACSGVLSGGCIAVYEHSVRLAEDVEAPSGFELLSTRKYGKTYVTYLRFEGE